MVGIRSSQQSSINDFMKVIGNGPSNILKRFLISSIIHSIWILTVGIWPIVSTSFAVNYFSPLVNDGLNNSELHSAAKSFSNVNPRSASSWFPGQWYFELINPDSQTIWISVARSLYPSERKVTAPKWPQEIRYFTVECFL